MGVESENRIDTALVKLFRTPRGCYLYSANRDNVIPIEEDTYSLIKQWQANSGSCEEGNREVAWLIENGFLSSNRVVRIEYPGEDLHFQLKNNVEQLVLQVTQACNLTCSYCPYANFTDGRLQRNHSNKHMSLETAKKAVDFLLAHSSCRNPISISFYGGEPLIEFDFIKEVIKYADAMAEGKQIDYNLTTNGTLFDDGILQYVVDHSINVLFSIDGPAEIHDINRRTPDGRGSFDKAFNNFKRLCQMTHEGKTKPSINMVLDPSNDLDLVMSLFEDEVFGDAEIAIYADLIDDEQLEDRIELTDDYRQKMEYYFFLGIVKYLQIVPDAKAPAFVTTAISAWEKACVSMKTSDSGELPNTGIPGGPCMPGIRRLFVTADERLYPCEKVSELTEAMIIGSLDDGFDESKVLQLLNIAQLTPDKCSECWAFRKCQLCAKHADNDGELSGAYKNRSCPETFNQALDVIRFFALSEECKTTYKGGDPWIA